mgnify:FL=1
MLTTTTLTAAIVEIPSNIYANIDGLINYLKHYKHAVDGYYLFPLESHNTHTIEVEISNGRFFEVTHSPLSNTTDALKVTAWDSNTRAWVSINELPEGKDFITYLEQLRG